MLFDGKFGFGQISIVPKLIHNFNKMITKKVSRVKINNKSSTEK